MRSKIPFAILAAFASTGVAIAVQAQKPSLPKVVVYKSPT